MGEMNGKDRGEQTEKTEQKRRRESNRGEQMEGKKQRGDI